MHTEPLDVIPWWGFFPAACAFLLLALEGGYRAGRWRHDRTPDEKDLPVGAIVASILGLLALVLGFTFSLAGSRFDARRMAVLEEANAIGTTYLRARLLPDPEGAEVAKLLREYVDVRLKAVHEETATEALARSEELHELLWKQATAAAAKDNGSIMTGLFIQSLNETIDLHAKRIQVGLHSRIPVVLWGGLFGLSVLGMASVGYQSGLTVSKRSPAMLVLALSFAFVLSLISGLDNGQRGLLRVSQQPIIDLQKSMSSPLPKGPPRDS